MNVNIFKIYIVCVLNNYSHFPQIYEAAKVFNTDHNKKYFLNTKSAYYSDF